MIATIQNVSRINITIIAGAFVTFTLFYLMQFLIANDGVVLQPGPTSTIVSPTIPELEIVVVTKTLKPDPIEPPLIAPPIVDALLVTDPFATLLPVVVGPSLVEPADPVDLTLTQGNLLALVQVQPSYPQRALQRGIEGYVVVEFDVDKQGLVTNPRVLVSEPMGIFDTAAIRAMGRWKYNPKMVNGNPVMVHNMRHKLSFTIAE